MIPYQSVGREHGMMPAVMANDMKITKEDRIIEHKKAVIAISKVSLSKWGAYEMLLHPDLIKMGGNDCVKVELGKWKKDIFWKRK